MTKAGVLVVLFSSLFAATTFAAAKPIAACSPRELSHLRGSAERWANDGYPNVFYLVNRAGKVVGYFGYDDDFGMHAELCDRVFHEDLTVSNEWYYWDETKTKSNPSHWKAGKTYGITQDEGLAAFKVLRASRDGRIVAEMTVSGWNEKSDEIVVRRDVVFFVKK